MSLLIDVLTVLRKGELQQRWNKEGQAALGMVDLFAALTEPAGFRLIGYFIQTAIFPGHEDAALLCGGDGQQVRVVCGDGVQRIREELHCS